jgi:hypothetical protein
LEKSADSKAIIDRERRWPVARRKIALGQAGQDW